MDQDLNEESSDSVAVKFGESSDSTVELNLKTLDSHVHTFQVDKNMPVLQFKEKIANELGVPVGQQRLIFRGKVLNDDHPLSEYHVESGHTLHLVERQFIQPQSDPATGVGETSGNGANRGNDAGAGAGAPRNRVGQISHSVVLGTLNVADQGEGLVPDLSRIIGAVLNTIGVGNQTTTNGTNNTQATSASQGNGERADGSAGNQGQAGSRPQSGQPFLNQQLQSFPHVMQVPTGATALPIPSLHAPIPDALTTLSEFISRMEQALSQNGDQPNSSNNTGNLSRVELPTNAHGLPTPEALGIVMRQAQQLLSNHAISALSHIAGSLERERAYTDSTVRGQLQTDSMQVGLAMQHFGALLLELGRTILTLRMGQSPAEAAVNAGPAVYISPSGPNPIMVQPFPLQTNSLFGGSDLPSNPVTLGPVGIGTVPRHVNIHIHAVGPRASNGDGAQGDRHSGTASADSGARGLPARNVIAASVPARAADVTISTPADSGQGVSISQSPDPDSLSTMIADVNSRIRGLIGTMQGENMIESGRSEASVQNSSAHSGTGNEHSNTVRRSKAGESSGRTTQRLDVIAENAPGPSVKQNVDEGSQSVPLGLGLGILDRGRGGGRQNSVARGGDAGGGSSTDRNQQRLTSSQQLLQAIASRSVMDSLNTQDSSSGRFTPAVNPAMHDRSLRGPGPVEHVDMTSAMSQVLQNPGLNGLLSGVSEQTGVGSPDVLRNMLQQFTQSPQMRNTFNQIAQHVDSQEVESMFSGMGAGQGSGGLDLSRMFQQMMPIVTRALSSGSRQPTSLRTVENEPWQSNEMPRGVNRPNDQNVRIDLQPVVQRIEHSNPAEEIFGPLVESSVRLSGTSSGSEDMVGELCQDEGLAREYLEMLQRDVSQRLEGDAGQGKS